MIKVQFVGATTEEHLKSRTGHLSNIYNELNKRDDVKVLFTTKKRYWAWYFDYLKFKPDFLVTYGNYAIVPALFRKLGLMRRKLIMYWHDYYSEISAKKRGIMKMTFLEYFPVYAADYIITISAYLREVANNFGKKVYYVEQGVSQKFLEDKRVVKLPFRDRKKLCFLYSGELSDYKKADLMIKAFKGKNAQLYIISHNDFEYKDIASSNVIFLGKKDIAEVPAIINSVDVCIAPSDQDSASKIPEYLAKGKPIIAFKGRASYVLDPMVNAYLTNDFSNAINVFINNPPLLKKLAKGAKESKVDTWNKLADKWVSILKKIKDKSI